jgi:hypothetical protein
MIKFIMSDCKDRQDRKMKPKGPVDHGRKSFFAA